MLIFLGGCSSSSKNTDLILSAGSVERIENFESKFIQSRNIDIWFPDGYNNSDEKYPVLYMHDGQMLFDSTKTWNKQEWQVDETMKALIDEELIQKTIVVGIHNTHLRHSEYFPQKPFESLSEEFQDSLINKGRRSGGESLFKSEVVSDNYLKFITKELKPFIDENYSVKKDRSNTFIAGSSMGGLISMYALCEYPEVFGGAACLSTHWIGTFDTINNPIPQAFIDYLDKYLPEGDKNKIYFDHGTETLDALYPSSQQKIDKVLQNSSMKKANWKSLAFPGADHTERAWSERLAFPLRFLLQK